jgi:hypothetical protein
VGVDPDAFSRHAHPGAGVAIVCVTDDRGAAEQASHDLSAQLATIGITAPLRLWADHDRWCDLDSGESGVRTEAARDRIAAMTVLTGRAQPAASRESLATSLIGDRAPIAEILPAARAAAAASNPQAEGAWAVGRLEQFHADGNKLGDGEAARMLVAMQSIPIRDGLWADINQNNVSSHVALWTDLTRRAPDEVRAAPASMLGFASWLNGDGARAWCALDQVPTDRPYSMATLVASALQAGPAPSRVGTPTNGHARGRARDWTAPFPRAATAQSRAVDRPAHGM